MPYKGVIVEESLENPSVLQGLKILKTDVEEVTENHKTPWLTQWTLHNVEVDEENADKIAETISKSFDYSHGPWYADFKNDNTHFIVFQNKIFKIDGSKIEEYQKATDYGISLGIPPHQVDFAPNVTVWKR